MQSTDIRLIVQDEGIETVKKVINRQEDEYLRDILKRVVSKIWFRSFTYFYWNEATNWRDFYRIRKRRLFIFSLYTKSIFRKKIRYSMPK